MKRIFSIGADTSVDEYLQRKIILSNKVGVFIGLFVGIPFIGISLIFFRPLTYLPAMGLVICFSTVLFNFMRLHTLARIIISVVPVLLASIYGAYLSHKGQAVVPGIAMVSLSFSFVIFLVFDLREKVLVIIMSLFMIAVMVGMDQLNDWFEVDLDTEIIETGFLSKLSILISILIGAGNILFLALQNQKAEEKANTLVNLSDDSLKSMRAKEQDLKQTLDKLEEAKREDQKRQWANEGLTKAIELVRTQQDLKKLCEQVLTFTIRYMKANQGGLFIVNQDNQKDVFLELEAAYAYDRKKFMQKRVSIGEGLLGQAYLERDYVYLKKIPQSYFNITSGLGTASPTCLLIVPLIVDEHILGVIEVASFGEFADFEINFLKLLGQNLASVIMQRKIANETKILLNNAQQQAEEMRAQEEEMRQNMEELMAAQEEMARKEREYLLRIETIERELANRVASDLVQLSM
jgi:hypothetical protein